MALGHYSCSDLSGIVFESTIAKESSANHTSIINSGGKTEPIVFWLINIKLNLSLGGDLNNILVVDDEEAVRDVVKDGLELFGYKVTVASNGQEGFEYFSRSNRFKLVITDVRMPIMDGIEFTRLIRNSERPDTPVIAITGFFEKTKVEEGLFNSIINKPFDLKFLKKIVGHHLGFK